MLSKGYCNIMSLFNIWLLQGTKAFCSGGDQALRSGDGYADFENFGRLNVLDLQVMIFVSILYI